MQRIFHPVGQGAFFSERFSETETPLNIVYDCGSTSLSTKFLKTKINSSFRKNETIDILFISHFHADHINGIEFLMKGRTIKNVVIPYLDDEEKALIKISNFLEEGYIETSIIDSPETFFGEDTRIIRVAADGDSRNLINELKDDFNIDLPNQNKGVSTQGSSTTIASGTVLRFSHLTLWQFIPFNYKMIVRAKPFVDAVEAAGLKLKDLNSIEKIQASKKILIEAYKKVDNDLNRTSLILYSGPITTPNPINLNPCYLNYERSFFPFKSIFHRAGCLYTGDADFNEPNLVSDLEKRLSDLTANIGTLVAPHHGAIVNFNEELLTIVPSLQSTIFPYGKENSYGHPSDSVVANIVGHNIFMSIIPDPWRTPRNMIIRVTEDVSSVAIFKFNIS